MAKLIRWETPFTDTQVPSVGLLISTNPDGADNLKAVIAPHGLDEYPKYLVNFGNVIAFTCIEEAFCPERDFDSTMFEERNLSAYQYLDSPWLKSYEGGRQFIAGGHPGPFYHYLISGGDNNVEVITPNIPTIDIIEQKGTLLIEYEV
ncbi:MAG TPA: hypothetical protein VF666_02085 [Pyrinomonadaceae bacterium]|jgi:hypothetical protein